MKKTLLVIAIMLGAALSASAVPAWPGQYRYRQPDGSIIVLQNHGDENYHWTTDEKGNVVQMDDKGFYRIVIGGEAIVRAGLRRASSVVMKGRWSSYEQHPVTNFGDRKVLCLLAEFTDVHFTIESTAEGVRSRFSDMLNMEGYSYDGAIGSVRDYYIDNSLNQYRPSFDVYGPVQLSNTSEYYDGNGGTVPGAIREAYELLSSQININDYDTDGNGIVDMVLFYYPGYNEAEGAPEYTIWPHQGNGNYGSLGAKTFNRYFCTSELRGNEENPGGMCAIGTTCHEFAHSLGLPDFYDTDYDSDDDGKYNRTTGPMDLMSSGNYNDDGRRPPYMSAIERNMLGWMPNMEVIDQSGAYELSPVQDNAGYISLSKTKGEYFIYEYRNGDRWDSALVVNDVLQDGMLYYRVDKSDRIVGDGRSAAYLWENTNKINAYDGHPCYRVESAVSGPKNWGDMYFPGANGITSLSPRTWAGEYTGLELSDIAVSGGKLTFTATLPDTRWLRGTITDASGNPVEGATVTLSRSLYALNRLHPVTGDISATSDASGKYEIAFPYSGSTDRILSAIKDGYSPVSMNLAATSRYLFKDMVLTAQSSPTFSDLGVAQARIEGGIISAVPAGGKTVKSVMWYVDGYQTGEEAPALLSGTHSYKVVFTYYDGSTERVLFDLSM